MRVERLNRCCGSRGSLSAVDFQPHASQREIHRIVTAGGTYVQIWALWRPNNDSSIVPVKCVCLFTFKDHSPYEVSTARWSPNGQYTASTDAGGVIHVLERNSKKCKILEQLIKSRVSGANCGVPERISERKEIKKYTFKYDGTETQKTKDHNCGTSRPLVGTRITYIESQSTQKESFKIFNSENMEGNLESWESLGPICCPSSVGQLFDISWAPDNRSIVGGGMNGQVAIFDIHTKEVVAKFDALDSSIPNSSLFGRGYIKSVAWDPMTLHIAVQSSSREISVWRRSPPLPPGSPMKWTFKRVLYNSKFFEKSQCDVLGGSRISWGPNGKLVAFPNAGMSNIDFSACYEIVHNNSLFSKLSGSTGNCDKYTMQYLYDTAEHDIKEDPLILRGHNSRVRNVRFCSDIMKSLRRSVRKTDKLDSSDRFLFFAQSSDDCVLSVWRFKQSSDGGTSFLSEADCLCIIRNVLDEQSSMEDLAWGNNGKWLAIAPSQGGLILIEFTYEELSAKFYTNWVHGLNLIDMPEPSRVSVSYADGLFDCQSGLNFKLDAQKEMENGVFPGKMTEELSLRVKYNKNALVCCELCNDSRVKTSLNAFQITKISSADINAGKVLFNKSCSEFILSDNNFFHFLRGYAGLIYICCSGIINGIIFLFLAILKYFFDLYELRRRYRLHCTGTNPILFSCTSPKFGLSGATAQILKLPNVIFNGTKVNECSYDSIITLKPNKIVDFVAPSKAYSPFCTPLYYINNPMNKFNIPHEDYISLHTFHDSSYHGIALAANPLAAENIGDASQLPISAAKGHKENAEGQANCCVSGSAISHKISPPNQFREGFLSKCVDIKGKLEATAEEGKSKTRETKYKRTKPKKNHESVKRSEIDVWLDMDYSNSNVLLQNYWDNTDKREVGIVGNNMRDILYNTENGVRILNGEPSALLTESKLLENVSATKSQGSVVATPQFIPTSVARGKRKEKVTTNENFRIKCAFNDFPNTPAHSGDVVDCTRNFTDRCFKPPTLAPYISISLRDNPNTKVIALNFKNDGDLFTDPRVWATVTCTEECSEMTLKTSWMKNLFNGYITHITSLNDPSLLMIVTQSCGTDKNAIFGKCGIHSQSSNPLSLWNDNLPDVTVSSTLPMQLSGVKDLIFNATFSYENSCFITILDYVTGVTKVNDFKICHATISQADIISWGNSVYIVLAFTSGEISLYSVLCDPVEPSQAISMELHCIMTFDLTSFLSENDMNKIFKVELLNSFLNSYFTKKLAFSEENSWISDSSRCCRECFSSVYFYPVLKRLALNYDIEPSKDTKPLENNPDFSGNGGEQHITNDHFVLRVLVYLSDYRLYILSKDYEPFLLSTLDSGYFNYAPSNLLTLSSIYQLYDSDRNTMDLLSIIGCDASKQQKSVKCKDTKYCSRIKIANGLHIEPHESVRRHIRKDSFIPLLKHLAKNIGNMRPSHVNTGMSRNADDQRNNQQSHMSRRLYQSIGELSSGYDCSFEVLKDRLSCCLLLGSSCEYLLYLYEYIARIFCGIHMMEIRAITECLYMSVMEKVRSNGCYDKLSCKRPVDCYNAYLINSVGLNCTFVLKEFILPLLWSLHRIVKDECQLRSIPITLTLKNSSYYAIDPPKYTCSLCHTKYCASFGYSCPMAIAKSRLKDKSIATTNEVVSTLKEITTLLENVGMWESILVGI